ncbi:MAG: right-handed parallel beta-helix repeat-containing protein [Candidatus Atribacteria bacterium]|nr:right-handed parallel beta-helix repeat-containing protein [Candidatus Atribacteria bacterium]
MRIIFKEKRKLCLVFFIILSLLFLSSCGSITPTEYTITATAGAGGSINPSGTVSVNDGGSKTFNITPEECYQISDVLVNGTSLGPVSTYTFVDVNQNYTIQASFNQGSRVNNLNNGKGYDTIQEAINDANVGDTIVVCPGTYLENLYLNNEDLILRSIDPTDPVIVASTIIDAGASNSVVWFFDDESTLEGFTIRNGYAIEGGGITMSYSSPVIRNNCIEQNQATATGGGIYTYFSSPHIKNNTIINNEAAYGGGIYTDASNPTIEDNSITHNEASNLGGGIYTLNTFSSITDNTITNNEATSGGGIYLSSGSSTVTGNTITDNLANNGGGIYVIYCSSTVTGNTFTDNKASYDGGGIYVYYGSELQPKTTRPAGWGTTKENIPSGELLNPAEAVEFTIAGNTFLGNKHGIPLKYTEGAHVFFQKGGSIL